MKYHTHDYFWGSHMIMGKCMPQLINVQSADQTCANQNESWPVISASNVPFTHFKRQTKSFNWIDRKLYLNDEFWQRRGDTTTPLKRCVCRVACASSLSDDIFVNDAWCRLVAEHVKIVIWIHQTLETRVLRARLKASFFCSIVCNPTLLKSSANYIAKV